MENIKNTKQILKEEKDEEMRDMAKEELDEMEERLPALEEEIKILLLPSDPKMPRMLLLKSGPVPVVMKPVCLPASSSECM